LQVCRSGRCDAVRHEQAGYPSPDPTEQVFDHGPDQRPTMPLPLTSGMPLRAREKAQERFSAVVWYLSLPLAGSAPYTSACALVNHAPTPGLVTLRRMAHACALSAHCAQCRVCPVERTTGPLERSMPLDQVIHNVTWSALIRRNQKTMQNIPYQHDARPSTKGSRRTYIANRTPRHQRRRGLIRSYAQCENEYARV
jgi:hypothetical protein